VRCVRVVPLALLSVVAGLLAGAPALASPGVLDSTDAAVMLGSAAARGAGVAAREALADVAARACAAIGGVAATVKPAGRPSETQIPTLPGRVWTWNGWVSGASGPETLDGSFSAFRGEPVGLVGAWADTGATVQTEMSGVEYFSGFDGQMDIAVGALVEGDTWAQAAAGTFVPRWTTAARRLKALRGGKGTTYIRIAHEMNGDWMDWGVKSTSLEAYKKGYRLYASIIRKEFPQARLTWSPNGGNHTDVSIDAQWPGDDVVDVIGPDIYDFDPDPTTAETWRREANAWLTPQSPAGLAAWQKYAARRGKPLALPEWGLASGDDPEWIRRVHAFLALHAAAKGSRNVAGKVVYDCYFNAEEKFKLFRGPNTSAGTAYAALTWGN
jgi:hypothetical protein